MFYKSIKLLTVQVQNALEMLLIGDNAVLGTKTCCLHTATVISRVVCYQTRAVE